MPGIDVHICAEGYLPDEEARELSDLGMRSHVEHVVLDGTVADQAALFGVLDRLRRVGMTIREVAPPQPGSDDPRHLRLAVTGHVGDILGAVVDGISVREEPARTIVETGLTSDDDIFDLLARIEALGLEIRALRIGRSGGRAGAG